MELRTLQHTLPSVYGRIPCYKMNVTYLWDDTDSNLARYINGTANPKGWAKQKSYEEEFRVNLAEMVSSLRIGLRGFAFNALIVPPTTRKYTVAMKNEFLKQCPGVRDLSRSIVKINPNLRFGNDNDLTGENMFENLKYSGEACLEGVTGLLLLDDVIKLGRSFAAVLALLQDNGLAPDCQIQAASLLCFVNGNYLMSNS